MIKETDKVAVEWGNKETALKFGSNTLTCVTNNDVLRALARHAPKYNFYGKTPIERTQVDHWLLYSLSSDLKDSLSYLDKSLGSSPFFIGEKLSIADLALFNEIYSKFQELSKIGLPENLKKWYNSINSQKSVKNALNNLPKDGKSKRPVKEKDDQAAERKQEGKFVDLPGAEMGKVIVRFPPEASGFLHIGHAKAALLNQYYQQAFKGKLIMRFDDTNPAKENVHFEEVILGDLEMLEIKPDQFTYTSDYFDIMLDYCEKLLKEGKAYADDTEPEQMKNEREQKIESKNRSNCEFI